MRSEVYVPHVSVVICALNMEQLLGRQLAAVLAQGTSFPFEVVVVDNGSTDRTRHIALGFAALDQRVRVIDAFPKGLNVARNAGVAAARGELIAMCDADDEVEPGWLSALVAAWRPGSYVAGALRMGGPNTPAQRRRWNETQTAPIVPRPAYAKVSVPTPSGANCLFSKAMWTEIGKFDERLSGAGDETDFFVRAHDSGRRCAEAPSAIVRYQLPPTARLAWRRGYRYGFHSAAVWQEMGLAQDERLLAKQFTWLAVTLPLTPIGRPGIYFWLHAAGKRTGEARYLLDRRRGA